MKYNILFILTMLLSGCMVVNTAGFYNGYKKLSEQAKKSVVLLDKEATINTLKKDTTVYAINGKQLKDCLSSNDTSLVYLWGPHCGSSSCILISSCQDYCTKRGYTLYVVADYYDMEMMSVQNKANTPLLIANHMYYNKYYANKLNGAFQKDLLNGYSLKGEQEYNRFLFFQKDSLIYTKTRLF
jgi:hypothetical protein